MDFVRKPDGTQSPEAFIQSLAQKVVVAANSKVRRPRAMTEASAVLPAAKLGGNAQVVIGLGASTGGTEATLEVLKRLPDDIPGMVIVQHMPVGFTQMYAERLNNQCRVAVKEAENGDVLERGKVLVAAGDKHMRLIRSGNIYRVECKEGERVNGHCPSVDVLFKSVASAAASNAVGVILTGMGGDGALGMLSMRKAGAHTIGQDEKSCVVYGMPKVAYDLGVC